MAVLGECPLRSQRLRGGPGVGNVKPWRRAGEVPLVLDANRKTIIPVNAIIRNLFIFLSLMSLSVKRGERPNSQTFYKN